MGGGGGVRGVGAEGVMQTSRWGNSGCCGCDWDCRLGCVDLLRSGCFGRAGGQLRAASCQQSSGVFQPLAVPGTLSADIWQHLWMEQSGSY